MPAKTSPSTKPATRKAPGPRHALMRLGPASAGAAPADADGDGEGGTDTQLVGSVVKAMRLLDAFRAGDGPLGNAELAERTGLSKPTVSRLAYTLARCGWLAFNARYRVYELGPAALALGNVAQASGDIRKLARPLMQELARQADFNVGLGTRENDAMVYLEACEGEGLVGLRLVAGSRVPILTSAMGRAWLAGLDEAQRDDVLRQLRPRHAADWPALEKAVARAVKDVATHGFCVSAGEWRKDIHGAAAPVRQPGGPVYALNLGGPAYLLPAQVMRDELGPRLAAIARQVEQALPGAAS